VSELGEPRIILSRLSESEEVRRILEEERISRIFDFETMVCINEEACRNVFRRIIEVSVGRERGLTANMLRWFRAVLGVYITAIHLRYVLSDTQKLDIARLMCQQALILFLTARANTRFINLLAEYAVLAGIERSSSIDAVAKLVCMLFKRPYESPDSWLTRLQQITQLILAAAGAAATAPTVQEVTAEL
jgi:hypothetical protein